jgi:hypothetical protein
LIVDKSTSSFFSSFDLATPVAGTATKVLSTSEEEKRMDKTFLLFFTTFTLFYLYNFAGV